MTFLDSNHDYLKADRLTQQMGGGASVLFTRPSHLGLSPHLLKYHYKFLLLHLPTNLYVFRGVFFSMF